MAGRFEYRPPPPPSPSASGGSSSSETSDEDNDEDDDRSITSSRPPSPSYGGDSWRDVDAERSTATPSAAEEEEVEAAVAAAAAAAVTSAANGTAASTNRHPSPIVLPPSVVSSPGYRRDRLASNASRQAPSALTAEATAVGATVFRRQTPSPSRKRGRQSTLALAGTGAADSGQPSCPPPQVSAPISREPHPAAAVAAVPPLSPVLVAGLPAVPDAAPGPATGPAMLETTLPTLKQGCTRNSASEQEATEAGYPGQRSSPSPQTHAPKPKEPTPATAEAPVATLQPPPPSKSLPPPPLPPLTAARQAIPPASLSPRASGNEKETPLTLGAAEPEPVGIGQSPRPTSRISTTAAAVEAVAAPTAANANPQLLSTALLQDTPSPRRKRGRPPSNPAAQAAVALTAVAPPRPEPLATARGLPRNTPSAPGATDEAANSDEPRYSLPTTRAAVAAAAASTRGLPRNTPSAPGATDEAANSDEPRYSLPTTRAAVAAAAASTRGLPRNSPSAPGATDEAAISDEPRYSLPTTRAAVAAAAASVAAAVAATAASERGFLQRASSPTRQSSRLRKNGEVNLGQPPSSKTPHRSPSKSNASIRAASAAAVVAARRKGAVGAIPDRSLPVRKRGRPKKDITPPSSPALPAPRNEAAPSQGSTASNKREVIGSKIRQQEQTVQRQQQQVQVTNLAPAHAGDADNGWDGDMGVDLGDCGDDFEVDSGSGSGGVDSCSGMKNRNRGEIASQQQQQTNEASDRVPRSRTVARARTRKPARQPSTQTAPLPGQQTASTLNNGSGTGGGGGGGSSCAIGQGASSASTRKRKACSPPGGAAAVQGGRKKKTTARSTAQQTRTPRKTPNLTAPSPAIERNAGNGGTAAASASARGEVAGASSTRDEDLALVWEVHQENEGLLAVRKRVRNEVVALQGEEDKLRRALGLAPVRAELARPSPQPLQNLPEPVAAAPLPRKKAKPGKQRRVTLPVQQRPRVSAPPPSPIPVGTAPSLPSAPHPPSPPALPCVSLERHPAAESPSNRDVAASSSPGTSAASGGVSDKDVLLGSPPISLPPVSGPPASSSDLTPEENEEIAKLLLECDDSTGTEEGSDSDDDGDTTTAAIAGGGDGGVRDSGRAHREAQANMPAYGVAPPSVWRGSPSRVHPDGKASPFQGTHNAHRKPPPAGGRGIGGVGLAERLARPGDRGVGGGRGQQPNSGREGIGAALRGGRAGRGASGGRGGVKKKNNYFDPNAPVKRRASGRGGASSRGIFGSRGGRSNGREVVGAPTGSRAVLGVGGRLGCGLTSVVGQRQPAEKATGGAVKPAGTNLPATASFPDGNKRPPGLKGTGKVLDCD